MAINWDAEIETIQQHWTENQSEIGQTERQREEIVQRYDDRLSALYTEGVTLNGEARFARRMKAEQEARHQATQQAGLSPSPEVESDAADAAAGGDAPVLEATVDMLSRESADTSEPNETASDPSLPEAPEAPVAA